MSNFSSPEFTTVVDFNQDLRIVGGPNAVKLLYTSNNTKDYKYLVLVSPLIPGAKESTFWVNIEGKTNERSRVVENVPQIPCAYFNVYTQEAEGFTSLMAARHSKKEHLQYMLKASYDASQPKGSQWTWDILPL